MTELSTELLDEMTKRLAESIQPEKIYLFGSHAAGYASRDRDVDLLIVVPDTRKSRHDMALKGRASLRDFIIPMDLVVYPFGNRKVARRQMHAYLYGHEKRKASL